LIEFLDETTVEIAITHSVFDNHVPGQDFRNIRVTNDHRFRHPQHIHERRRRTGGAGDGRGVPRVHFPKASGDPLSPDEGNRRQDNVFDYVYDPRNSLGPWTITFPSYTAAAFNTAPGRQALASMGVRHAVEAAHAPGIFE